MFHIYKVSFDNKYTLVKSVKDIEQAKSIAKRAKAVIKIGGMDGTVCADYRN